MQGTKIPWVLAGGSLLSLVFNEDPRDKDLFVSRDLESVATVLAKAFHESPQRKGDQVIRVGAFDVIKFESATNVEAVLGSFDLNICMLGWKGEFEDSEPLLYVGEPLWNALDTGEITVKPDVVSAEARLMHRLGKYIRRTGWMPEEKLKDMFLAWYAKGMPPDLRHQFLIRPGTPVPTVKATLSVLRSRLTKRDRIHHILELIQHGDSMKPILE